jgi:tripartite ATP-independent transporter DctP family solute receptor
MMISRRGLVGSSLVLAAPAILSPRAARAEVRRFNLGYDQPHTTAYGVAADIFAAKLEALSKGTMVIDQFPGAQLGQEPQALQKIRTGDIDFIFSATANAATLSPQAGVFSIHYLFRNERHLKNAVTDAAVTAALRDLFAATVQGARMVTWFTLGLRSLYGKKEVHSVADVKGLKIRVQATATEDTMFPAYGAQTVHMPFGNVYTSLQTGVVDMAENGVSIYQLNKHYEVAPVMSLTEHEANCNMMWVSDKVWQSLTDEQRGWVTAAGNEVAATEPDKAFQMEHDAVGKLQKLGVKFVLDVDKSGFMKVAEPLQDKLAGDLGPQATGLLKLCRGVAG